MGRRLRALAVVAATAGLTLPAVLPPPDSAAVANGLPVPAGRYRFAVKLIMTHVPGTKTGRSACSGALISPTFIITAGHCFRHRTGVTPFPTTATFDTNDVRANPGVTREVVRVISAPRADVALGRLARPAAATPDVRLGTTRPKADEVLTLAGWGATGHVNPVPSHTLHWGQVKVRTRTATTLGVIGYRPSAYTSACLYDSGAPYFVGPYRHSPPVLVATESDGPRCPHDRVETTERIDTLVPWIRRHVPDLPG